MTRHLTLCFILLVMLIDKSEACFCDHYPWTHWSSCSKSCNSGTQSRQRQVVVNDYYWKNLCDKLCNKQETRECNLQTCPINCVLGDYGTWSDCDPCTEKQVKVKSVLRPSQFGGQPCTEPLVTFQPCVPSKLCKIEETNCKNKFLCDSGRCIPSKLECNGENDCGDNSDERNCGRTKPVCTRIYTPIPSVQLMGTGTRVPGPGSLRTPARNHTGSVRNPKTSDEWNTTSVRRQVQTPDIWAPSLQEESLPTESTLTTETKDRAVSQVC